MQMLRYAAFGTVLYAICSPYAWAFSFQGTFQNDNDVQLFALTLNEPAEITLRTYSFAGGRNEAGAEIIPGGFDPVLTLFDGTGNIKGFHDDISLEDDEWDALLGPDLGQLPAGMYTLALTMYDNFADGNSLRDGFRRDNDAQFCDRTDPSTYCGDRHWAVDIVGASSAAPLAAVPLPAAIGPLGLGLLALFGIGANSISRRRP